jgi:hypothetical protein
MPWSLFRSHLIAQPELDVPRSLVARIQSGKTLDVPLKYAALMSGGSVGSGELARARGVPCASVLTGVCT